MTAEVAVLNKGAVALAADSAVTIGRSGGKIYTSADKLFQLSDEAPIAFMVYGNADFINLPWETLVKSYRRKLGRKRLGHVADYAADFWEYVGSNKTAVPDAVRDAFVEGLISGPMNWLRERMKGRLEAAIKQSGSLTTTMVQQEIDGEVARQLAGVRGVGVLETFESRDLARIRLRHGRAIYAARAKIFGALPFSPTGKRDVVRIVLEMATRYCFRSTLSGCVVAGFGEDEYMPALIAYKVEGMVLDRVRRWPVEDEWAAIGDDSASAVAPFAQREMVDTFMQGIDPDLGQFMRDTAATVVGGAVSTIVEEMEKKFGAGSTAGAVPDVSELMKMLFAEWSQKREEHWGPVLSIVQSLPKDELGAMAEALVNLTKFKRRVTVEQETVGGPIDVAVVTKGDGFVWVKRKHYFDPALNPRQIGRIQRGNDD